VSIDQTTDKPAIRHLVDLCVAKGIKRVIASPGSRNAPLSIAFHQHPEIETLVIPDERVAAFVAMGMSQYDGVPTALFCTSGSALLNYAPAVAEAFYLRIPLVVISADRPQEWIDQMEGQTMHQENSLANFTNYEVTLPQEAAAGDDLWYSDRLVNEAIDAARFPKPGPVHINVPLKEPLYGRDATTKDTPKVIQKSYAGRMALEERQVTELVKDISRFDKVMVMVGVLPDGDKYTQIVQRLTEEKNVVLLCENTSNLHGEKVNSLIDASLACIPESSRGEYIPELIITFGGPLISKKIKRLFRTHSPKSHWHIDRADAHIDSFKALDRAIQAEPFEVLEALSKEMGQCPSAFSTSWQRLKEKSVTGQSGYMASAPVRYMQLMSCRADIQHYSNRGVSGIDGCTSTAVGMALCTDRTVTLLTGDMAFYYDSNALWHRHLPSNLKIIVINNGGGGIFRIIPGPRSTPELEEYFEAHMDNRAEKLAAAYDINYLKAENKNELTQSLEALYKSEGTTILEVLRIDGEVGLRIRSPLYGELLRRQDGSALALASLSQYHRQPIWYQLQSNQSKSTVECPDYR